MRTYVSHLKISKTPIGDKNEFSKNISKNCIKMKKYLFFQDKSFGKKKAHAGSRRAKQKQVFEKHKQGGHEKDPAKGTEKKWSWMVSLYRPWQDPIGQGHGEWNGNRERLYGMAMGLPGKGQNSKKINQKHQITRIWGRGWSKLTFD